MGMSHAYGKPADKSEMTELLAEAIYMGYTFFFTAELYGSPSQPNLNVPLAELTKCVLDSADGFAIDKVYIL